MTDFYSSKEINLDIFSDLCNQSVLPGDYPVATAVESNVIIYQRDALYEALIDENRKRLVQRELHNCLRHGPGVFVIRNFYNNNRIVDESTNIFRQIIDEEQAGNENTGDHFANAGENERIWNSFQKVCERNPQSFIEYYKNPLYTLVSESWLGPGYQMSAQVNVVKPGGKAQAAHRDYHLGFQSEKVIQRFPLPLQVASQYLTLQGAIAHTDMPPQTGPTMLLPFSQQYELGYLAWRNLSFKDFFSNHAVQLRLNKGDAIFFSPALFHAAGQNTSSKDRIANLLQISVAFGKPMESINRYRMMKLTYPHLLEKMNQQSISDIEIMTIVDIIADNYSFPTNLDLVPPVNGLAPETARQMMIRAVGQRLSVEQFQVEVNKHASDRRA